MQTISKKYMCRWLLPDLLSLVLYTQVPNIYAVTIEAGFSLGGIALQLVLKTIETAQQETRLMDYSFTSPEVAWALVGVKRRGVGVGVVLDWEANTGRDNNTSKAAMNLLVGAGIPARTVSVYKILHDKVIVVDDRNTQASSFNSSRATGRSNSENALAIWNDPILARSYLNRQISRQAQGTDWKQTY